MRLGDGVLPAPGGGEDDVELMRLVRPDADMPAEGEINLPDVLRLAVEVRVVQIALRAARALVDGFAASPDGGMGPADGDGNITEVLHSHTGLADVGDRLLACDLIHPKLEVLHECAPEACAIACLDTDSSNERGFLGRAEVGQGDGHVL